MNLAYDFGQAPFAVGSITFGRIDYEQGNFYLGEVKAGTNQRHGRGVDVILAEENPFILEAWWKDDDSNFRGRLIWASGDVYEGEVHNEVRTGKGTYRWPNGERYEGDWLDGNQHGQGTMHYVNGDRYEGQWANDEESGKGTYFFANGDKEEGYWRLGQRYGYFTVVAADGKRRIKKYPEGTWLN